MASSVDGLRRGGLLAENHSFSELSGAKEKARPYAYCYYYECCRKFGQPAFKRQLTKHQYRCPDCSKELTWKISLVPRDVRRLAIEKCEHSFKFVWVGNTFSEDTKCELCNVWAKDYKRGWYFW